MASEGASASPPPLALEERVFVHGLSSERGRAFNLLPARVVSTGEGDDGSRVGVEVLFGGAGEPSRSKLRRLASLLPAVPCMRCDGDRAVPASARPARISVKPANLLRACLAADRRRVLLAQVVDRLPALLVVRKFLDERLPSGAGAAPAGRGCFTQDTSPLLFRIAEFVAAPRVLPHQFSGYMGQLWWECWRYDAHGEPMPLGARVSPQPGCASSDPQPLVPRLDCAVAKPDDHDFPGLVVFAGGCGNHPQRCRHPGGFYRSAVLYDALLDEWSPLPDMPTRRHGASAAAVGSEVYVMGGQYVHGPDEEGDEMLEDIGVRFCDVLDLHTRTWRALRVDVPPGLSGLEEVLNRTAFFGTGSVGGRIVACVPLDRQPLAQLTPSTLTVVFNPARQEDGWRIVELGDPNSAQAAVAASTCAAEFRGELVVASGRPASKARVAAAFRFDTEPSDANWHRGTWRRLPDLNHARVGGALVVVEGRLYATGGVCEETGEFRDDAERLDLDGEGGSCSEWTLVPWFRMPRPLHAHSCVALPTLAC